MKSIALPNCAVILRVKPLATGFRSRSSWIFRWIACFLWQFPVISGYAPKSECKGTLTYKWRTWLDVTSRRYSWAVCTHLAPRTYFHGCISLHILEVLLVHEQIYSLCSVKCSSSSIVNTRHVLVCRLLWCGSRLNWLKVISTSPCHISSGVRCSRFKLSHWVLTSDNATGEQFFMWGRSTCIRIASLIIMQWILHFVSSILHCNAGENLIRFSVVFITRELQKRKESKQLGMI